MAPKKQKKKKKIGCVFKSFEASCFVCENILCVCECENVKFVCVCAYVCVCVCVCVKMSCFGCVCVLCVDVQKGLGPYDGPKKQVGTYEARKRTCFAWFKHLHDG